MNEIIVTLPKLPELYAPQLHSKRLALPRLKKLELKKNPGRIMSAFNTNIRNEGIGIRSLKINALLANKKKEKVLTAGRGGVHYGKTSSMGRMAEGK